MYKYILRFSLLPTVDFEEKCTALLDFCEKAEIDDVMFFISPEEVSVGHITIEQAKKWVEPIRRMSAILKERGITTSLNPWVTLNHYDGGRPLQNGQNFTTLVGQNGTVAKSCVCPLDKNWRAYIAELWSFYVDVLQPDVIWIEDDMRLSNHEPVDLGCFCDEHMKLYNEYLGTSYDRETFVKKIITDPDCRRAYHEVSGRTIEDTLKFLVAALPRQRSFGIMTGGTGLSEGRKYSEIYTILGANGGKPYNRVCLNSYRQSASQLYAWRYNSNSMWMRSLGKNRANFVSEIEDFPHSLYTKSAGFLKYQLLSSAALNLCGVTLSIFDFCGNGIYDGDRYAKVLKECKPFLSKINDLQLSPLKQVGVNVLYCENSSRTVALPENSSVGAINPREGWCFAMLEAMGVACAYTDDVDAKNKIVALSGQVVRNFSETQLRALFERNFVFITADCLHALCDMGLGYLVGVDSCEWWQERSGKYSMEELATGENVKGVSRLRATSQFFCGDYLHVNYSSDVKKKVYTNVLDYNENIVGCGLTRVGNALVFPYSGNTRDFDMPISLICPLRAYAIKTALGENEVNYADLFTVEEENVCPYVFKKDGKYYVVLVNFADDDYRRVNLDMHEREKVFSAMALTPKNERIHRIASVCEKAKMNLTVDFEAHSACLLACQEVDIF